VGRIVTDHCLLLRGVRVGLGWASWGHFLTRDGIKFWEHFGIKFGGVFGSILASNLGAFLGAFWGLVSRRWQSQSGTLRQPSLPQQPTTTIPIGMTHTGVYVGWEGRGKGFGSQAPSADSLAFPNPPPRYPQMVPTDTILDRYAFLSTCGDCINTSLF
jgi:hypothetical protein